MIVGSNSKFYILTLSFDLTRLSNVTFYVQSKMPKPENERIIYWYRLIFGVNNFYPIKCTTD